MKKLFLMIAVGVLATGVASAQALAKAAVVEFTPGPNAVAMTAEAKRQLQASIAFLLHDSRRFHIVDVRHTRDASQSILPAVNDEKSTTVAVRVGKQLGVAYVLTGIVTDYTASGGNGGAGHATLRARLVEVATGTVAYAGEIAQKGTSPMRTTGMAEMQSKVMKPAAERLASALGAKL